MPIVTGEIVYRLSGGASNSVADASLGGVRSTTTTVPSALFDPVTGAQSAAGLTEYRCYYVHNTHGTLAMLGTRLWIGTNTTASEIAVGLGSAAINATEQTVANEATAPAAVAFSQPATSGAALVIGDIPAGQHKAVWLRRIVAPGSPARNQSYSIALTCDTEA